MSLMQFNNLSLLTYGALGITGIVLAIATVYEYSETEIPKEEEESSIFSTPKEEPAPSSSFFGTETKTEEPTAPSSGLFGTEPKPKEEPTAPSSGLFGTEPKPKEERGLFDLEPKEGEGNIFGNNRMGGKKKKRRTKKRGGGSKKSRKTKHRKSRQQKSKKH
jgi:hypothetical protein